MCNVPDHNTLHQRRRESQDKLNKLLLRFEACQNPEQQHRSALMSPRCAVCFSAQLRLMVLSGRRPQGVLLSLLQDPAAASPALFSSIGASLGISPFQAALLNFTPGNHHTPRSHDGLSHTSQ